MDKSAALKATRLMLQHFRKHEYGFSMMPHLKEIDGRQFNAAKPNFDYRRYIEVADRHYYIARTLLLEEAYDYGLFCVQQCVETYLKAYLLRETRTFPSLHDLPKLLDAARQTTNQPEFIGSDELETICLKYNPFNEIARYPDVRRGPEGDGWAVMSGEDLAIIDYFVHEMRTFLDLGDWRDILKGNQPYLPLAPAGDFLWAAFIRDNYNVSNESNDM